MADVLRRNDMGGWTRAAPDLYPHQWSWDSACIAIGYSGWDQQRAQDEGHRRHHADEKKKDVERRDADLVADDGDQTGDERERKGEDAMAELDHPPERHRPLHHPPDRHALRPAHSRSVRAPFTC